MSLAENTCLIRSSSFPRRRQKASTICLVRETLHWPNRETPATRHFRLEKKIRKVLCAWIGAHVASEAIAVHFGPKCTVLDATVRDCSAIGGQDNWQDLPEIAAENNELPAEFRARNINVLQTSVQAIDQLAGDHGDLVDYDNLYIPNKLILRLRRRM